jgi:hypothetical protein
MSRIKIGNMSPWPIPPSETPDIIVSISPNLGEDMQNFVKKGRPPSVLDRTTAALKIAKVNATLAVFGMCAHGEDDFAEQQIEALQQALLPPAILDLYWACYFGSGNEKWVEKVIATAISKPRSEAERDTIRVALWSLRSLAETDPKITALLNKHNIPLKEAQ